MLCLLNVLKFVSVLSVLCRNRNNHYGNLRNDSFGIKDVLEDLCNSVGTAICIVESSIENKGELNSSSGLSVVGLLLGELNNISDSNCLVNQLLNLHEVDVLKVFVNREFVVCELECHFISPNLDFIFHLRPGKNRLYFWLFNFLLFSDNPGFGNLLFSYIHGLCFIVYISWCMFYSLYFLVYDL